jgi:hypothetical protein
MHAATLASSQLGLHHTGMNAANFQRIRTPRLLILAIGFITLVYLIVTSLAPKKIILGATAEVTEPDSGFVLKARVDTGASVSSLHFENIIVENASDDPAENSGKNVQFLLEGPNGKQHWLQSTILGYAGVRSAAGTANRYRVRIKLTCKAITKETLVSLNDRAQMKYPLLLGRDFLEGDFVVDVSLDDPDFP